MVEQREASILCPLSIVFCPLSRLIFACEKEVETGEVCAPRQRCAPKKGNAE